MRKITGICLVFYFCLLISNQNIASGYGYAKEEDPLIKVFKAVILHGRQADWPKVATEVNSISDRTMDIYRIFKIDFKSRIDHAVQQQDFQTLANHMANLIFLAIREKFYYNRKEGLEIFIRSKVRLRLAEEYYTILLAGNVRDYDARHNTNLHESIYNRFVKARDTLGSTGFFGAGSVKPNVKEFDALTREIEALLLKAFPYFETGEADPP
ncbi:MAG: hypothetical protein ACK41Q_09935 [Candidatus Brocadia sp.]